MPEFASASLKDSGLPKETKANLEGFARLHRVWDSWAAAAHELSLAVGVPLCVDGCGLCCTTNTPAAWGIEVVRAAAWLLEQTPEARNRILDKIEAWLVKPVLEVEPPIQPNFTLTKPLMGKACQRGRCPLLGDDLRCTVYEVRPIGCRSYGVTVFAAHYCKRPSGRGEDDEHRALFAGDGTAELRARIRALRHAMREHPGLLNTSLFPTALYAKFRPERIVELLPHIPTARLVGGRDVFWAKMFEDALDTPVPVPEAALV